MPETDRMIYLKVDKEDVGFIVRHLNKLLYPVVFVAGAAVAQLSRNIELTEAVGLAVRTVAELAGFFLCLGLIALGAWTAIQLITGKED